jgi:hypothetical protein
MEPERKIEKWLKAYAKKRRTQTGEPFKLHPATRRLLQSEVARDKPKLDDEEESVSLWEVIRQQWAILLSFAACIFLVGMIFFHSALVANKKTETLATATGTREISVNAPAAANEDKLPPSPGEKKDLDLARNGLAGEESNTVLLADDRKALVNRDTEYATNNAPSPTVAMTVTPSAAPGLSQSIAATPLEVSPAAPVTPPASAPVVAGENFAVAKQPESLVSVSNSLNGSYASQPTTPPLVAAAVPSENLPTGQAGERLQEAAPGAMPPVEMPASERNPVTFSGQAHLKSELGPVASRQLGEFQNAYKNSITPLTATPVLANFQVQQNGNVIRLVDQDGSVYDGSLQSVNRWAEKTEDQSDLNANRRAVQNAVTVVAGLPSQQITAAQDALQVAQTYFFHVYGTNRTVNQTVAFTGSLMANSVPTNSAKLAFGLTDHAANAGGGGFGGFGGGGGGGAVGGTFDRTKSETTNQLAQLPWADLRITGTAVVNRTNRIEIDAAPVAPNKN